MIRKCAVEGSWAALQNIHLEPNMLDYVLDHLMSDSHEISPNFRIWIIGYSCPRYTPRALQNCTSRRFIYYINRIVQKFLLQSFLLDYCKINWSDEFYEYLFLFILKGVKIVRESAKSFRDSLLEVIEHNIIRCGASSRAPSANSSIHAGNSLELEKENDLYRSDKWHRLSLAVSCFHALLQERNRYKGFGFTGRVEFTLQDLKSALTIIKVRFCFQSWNAFEILLKNCSCVFRIVWWKSQSVLTYSKSRNESFKILYSKFSD